MPQQAVTIENLPQAFEVVKEMQAGGPERGDIERDVPRTRHFCPTGVPKGSARRAPEIDRAILAGVVPGLSTRRVGEILLALPGRPVPAATVSRVAGTIDAFRRAGSESAVEREHFLDRPYHRGLTGKGLLATLPIVRHGIPVRRCRAHRIRNILDKVRAAHRDVRRRTRPTGTFRDRTSMDRVLHAVFIHESRSRGISTPLSPTHDS